MLAKLFRLNMRLGYWLLLLLLFITLLYVSFGRWFSPLLTEYKADVEQLLGRELQQAVSLGEISAQWQGFSPVIRADQVRIGQGVHALQAQQLSFQPDVVKSVLKRQWQLAAISIEGLQLRLEQDEQGRWALSGIESRVSPVQTAGQLSLADFLGQVRRIGRISILETRLHVQPWQAESFVFEQAGISFLNRDGRLDIQARLQLPDRQVLELAVNSRGTAADWRELDAEIYVQVPDSDWMQWLPPGMLPASVKTLSLGGQFWLQLAQGQLTQGVVQLTHGQLIAQYREQTSVLRLGAATGYYRADAQQRKLWFDSLPVGFSAQEPLHDWPLHVTWLPGPEQAVGVVELRLPSLELEPVMQMVAAHLDQPLIKEVWNSLDVRGQLKNAHVRWQPDAPLAEQLSFDTNLEQVRFSHWRSVPGASGVSGRIRGNLQGGELQLDSQGFMLGLNDLFAEPWHYARAGARLTWSFDEDGFWLTSPYLQVQGEEGEIAGDFVIRLLNDPQAEDYLDLRVGMRDGDAAFTQRYLPRMLEKYQPHLYQWLIQAVRGGRVHEGFFQYQGSISKHTPPEARSFSLFFDVEDAGLDYQPGWPRLKDGRAQVFVHDWGVQVELEHGRVLNTGISKARAEVIYAPDDAVTALELEAQLASSVTDGLHVLQQTPLAQQVSALSRWTGQGQIPARLKLRVPFASGQMPQVDLRMQLQAADLKMPEQGVELEKINGEVVFDSRSGVWAEHLEGLFLQQPFVASLEPTDTAEGLATRIDVQGNMQVKPLQDWLAPELYWPWQGSFDYQLRLMLDGEDSQLVVDTDLQGTSLELPEPLGKSAGEKIATRWQMTLDGRERHYRLSHGQRASLFAVRDTAAEQVRGELQVGRGVARLPLSRGLVVRGELVRLPILEWLDIAGRYAEQQDGGQSPALIQKIDLSAQQVTGLGIPLEQARINYAAGEVPGSWKTILSSKQLAGELEQPAAQQPLRAEIEYLHLPDFGALLPDDSRVRSGPPVGLPPMQIGIEQLYSAGELMGRWQMSVLPIQGGTRFQDLDLQLRGLEVGGQLDWLEDASRFSGELRGENIGRVLKNWGYAESLSSESFRGDLDLHWPGGLTEFSLEKLSGDIYLSFRRGQLYSQDVGSKALRIFGLLNFDTIGRRLRLDFSDLLGKGLAYDSFKGDFAVDKGVYRTKEAMLLKGVSSELAFEGELDLPSGKIAASLQVAMPISSNLPLAAVLAGAPAVGGALFVMERLVGDRMDRMATVRYRISGDWQNPEMTLMDKN